MSSQLQSCASVKDDVLPHIGGSMEVLFPEMEGGLYEYDDQQNLLHLSVQWGNSPITKLYDWLTCKYRGQQNLCYPLHSMLPCPHLDISYPAEFVCVPLQDKEVLYGHLHLYGRPGVINQSNLELVRTVADQIILTLSDLNMRRILQDQSLHDPLTDLFNRRYMEETLYRELEQAALAVSSLAIWLFTSYYFAYIIFVC